MKSHKAIADAGEAIRFNPRLACALLFRSLPIATDLSELHRRTSGSVIAGSDTHQL
jgi:hypothetical protein